MGIDFKLDQKGGLAMRGETENYYHFIRNVRRHAFGVGFNGYIVEGESQRKDDEQHIYSYIAQTDLFFQTFAGECFSRPSDEHELNRQGIRCFDISVFFPIPQEIKEFIKGLEISRRRYVLRMRRQKRR